MYKRKKRECLINSFHFIIILVPWQVIDHYENPRNVGKLDAKSNRVGTGLVGAPACGDVMKLQIEVKIKPLK